MKITWIGQAGLIFEINNTTIMFDPYLSDSVEKINKENYRRVKVKEELFDIKPDIMIFTHNHLDHYDPETVSKFISDNTSVTVLSPDSVWKEVKGFGGKNNYIRFSENTVWTEKGIEFNAVYAEHSDPSAIGVVINDGEKKYYITGDSLYNKKIFTYLPDDIYAVFLPINGVGNNMNMTDAKKFVQEIQPKFVIPLHCGMFDSIDMNLFDCENKIVPQIYEEVILK